VRFYDSFIKWGEKQGLYVKKFYWVFMSFSVPAASDLGSIVIPTVV